MTEPDPSEQPQQQTKDMPVATEQLQQQPLKRHTEDELDTRDPKAPKLTAVEDAEADELTAEFIVAEADEDNMVDLSPASADANKQKGQTANDAKIEENASDPEQHSYTEDMHFKLEEAVPPSANRDTVEPSQENSAHMSEPPQIIAPPPPPPGLHLLTPEQQQQLLQSSYHGGREFATTLAQAMITPVTLPPGSELPSAVLIQQMQQNGLITPLAGPPPSLKSPQSQPASIQSSASPQPLTQPSTSPSQPLDQQQEHHVPSQASPSTSAHTSPSTSPQPPSQLIPAATSPTLSTTAPMTTANTSPMINNNSNNDKQRPAARNLSNDEKRQRRLLRNRVAAKECRKKKKQHIKDMEQRILQLEEENRSLRNHVDELRGKLGMSPLGTALMPTASVSAPTASNVSTAPALDNHPAMVLTATTSASTSAPPLTANASTDPVLTTAPVMNHTLDTSSVATSGVSSNATAAAVHTETVTQRNDSNTASKTSSSTNEFYTTEDAEELKALNDELISDKGSTASTSKEKKDESANDITDGNSKDNDVVMEDVEQSITTSTVATKNNATTSNNGSSIATTATDSCDV